ncbi:hypothetical protein OXPF_02740 [Oxobacter pfennigii]|uniref:Uncharacterized protein n=1 Tax=Oxobacter pfennigii TaxID=36849 RepID=A0A0P8WBV8_9CLOT|nr:YdhW family putative oxidoreductase system protein [Oxobacter pfennigii]KPU46164.1 hypothetical protein OXPF_02740 [Oxobacter pfennigii]
MSIEFDSNNNLSSETNNQTEDKIDEQLEEVQAEVAESEDTEEVEKDKITLIGEFIRDRSEECKITSAEDLLDEPFSLEVDEVFSTIDELKLREEFKDIYTIKGAQAIYLFSDKFIVINYAKMMVLVEEKDMFKLIADTVRFDSKTYPRPTNPRVFLKSPFNLSKEIVDDILVKIKAKPEYADIKESRASNNVIYLFSENYMSQAYADSLTEWLEVGLSENP